MLHLRSRGSLAGRTRAWAGHSERSEHQQSQYTFHGDIMYHRYLHV